MIQGINVCNPVVVEKDYLMYAVDYAIKNKINHIQINGPIHNPEIGNIDGMTVYRKYSRFNTEKDMDFIERTKSAINEASKKASDNGVKMYVWHHELEVPITFKEAFPEILNSYGDVEVTHPIIKDFVENKLEDFFFEYPLIDGIVLTLHETRIPLLKLKNQKLDKIERVKYVTEILYKKCKELGKELIVRPFASIEEDYSMMTQAYEQISKDMIMMDKWTQFDWSLTLPHNRFFSKIKNNPLLVETDIFGEFFGKGKLPLMLKEHIKEKVEYCKKFNTCGYVSRIDRDGRHQFEDVNEVNIYIMLANMRDENVDEAIERFFKAKYPNAYKEMLSIMSKTEDILKKIIYLKSYYFSSQSEFPTLNHSKNHFYFEMMREDYAIESGEWFIPTNWNRGSIESVIAEKKEAVREADKLLREVYSLEYKIEAREYAKLLTKFKNLKYVSAIWLELTRVFVNYVKYFETLDLKYELELEQAIKRMRTLDRDAKAELSNDFYCDAFKDGKKRNLVESFIAELGENFEAEKKKTLKFRNEGYTDFVICGGAMEGHKLKKEVNFSDTYIRDGEIYRIPGSGRGNEWSVVNAHGWFSYELKVKPDCINKIRVTFGSSTDMLNVKVTIGDAEYLVNKAIDGKTEIEFEAKAEANENICIRFDKIAKDVPYIYDICVR